MAFDTKHSDDEQIAHLQSELMQPVDHACLEFWYYMDMWYSIGKVCCANIQHAINKTY